MSDINIKAEQAIYTTMLSRGDKIVKRVLSDDGITLHFEGTLGFQEEPTKYIIDIREDKFG